MYRFTNVTGRTKLVGKTVPAVLVIDNNAVRPEEQRLFSAPTSDILTAWEAGSISIEKDRIGSWVALRAMEEFEGFAIERVEHESRVATVDGTRISKVVSFKITEGNAPEAVVAPETVAEEETDEEEATEEEATEEEADEPQEFEAPTDEEEPVVAEEPESDFVPSIESAGFNAKDAVAHIEATPAEELEGFLSEGESRKSVLTAWEAKFAS